VSGCRDIHIQLQPCVPSASSLLIMMDRSIRPPSPCPWRPMAVVQKPPKPKPMGPPSDTDMFIRGESIQSSSVALHTPVSGARRVDGRWNPRANRQALFRDVASDETSMLRRAVLALHAEPQSHIMEAGTVRRCAAASRAVCSRNVAQCHRCTHASDRGVWLLADVGDKVLLIHSRRSKISIGRSARALC
jgi:hypothetical protein